MEKRILLWVICTNIGATTGAFASVIFEFHFLLSAVIGLTTGIITAFIIDIRTANKKKVPKSLVTGKYHTNGTADKSKKTIP
jgi:hypothetical protein